MDRPPRRGFLSLPTPPDRHPFIRSPHRTFFGLALPVMASLAAEPLTGIVDTAFVARLGSAPLAALGAGTILLSSLFWIFNFLGIGTGTEVAHAHGRGDTIRARDAAGLAIALALAIGLAIALVGWWGAAPLARFMTDEPAVQNATVAYLKLRLLGGPAVLITLAAFGALRGLQDMRTLMRIAVVTNLVNVILDPILIFGAGPIPAFGVEGAAAASSLAHWAGAIWGVLAVRSRLGLPERIRFADARSLLIVGRDLFVRTGLLIAFLLLSTRTATRAGMDTGAAHQAIRQIWIFTAFVLDAYAAAAQSLVGYFLGGERIDLARRVARIACGWGIVTGGAIGVGMLVGEAAVAALLVPASATGVFAAAWLVSALALPVNAVSFVTDGIHWGARDYRYLRNSMLVATGVGAALLAGVELDAPGALAAIWWVTGVWISLRALLGVVRVWPGVGDAPLGAQTRDA